MELYEGIDLHSSNNFLGIINEKAKKLLGKKLSNDINIILHELKPFKKELKGIVVGDPNFFLNKYVSHLHRCDPTLTPKKLNLAI